MSNDAWRRRFSPWLKRQIGPVELTLSSPDPRWIKVVFGLPFCIDHDPLKHSCSEEAMAADSAAMYQRMSFDRGHDPAGVHSSAKSHSSNRPSERVLAGHWMFSMRHRQLQVSSRMSKWERATLERPAKAIIGFSELKTDLFSRPSIDYLRRPSITRRCCVCFLSFCFSFLLPLSLQKTPAPIRGPHTTRRLRRQVGQMTADYFFPQILVRVKAVKAGFDRGCLHMRLESWSIQCQKMSSQNGKMEPPAFNEKHECCVSKHSSHIWCF